MPLGKFNANFNFLPTGRRGRRPLHSKIYSTDTKVITAIIALHSAGCRGRHPLQAESSCTSSRVHTASPNSEFRIPNLRDTVPNSDLWLHLRNIVVLLVWSTSQYSLFLHLIRVPSSFTEGGTLIRPRRPANGSRILPKIYSEVVAVWLYVGDDDLGVPLALN